MNIYVEVSPFELNTDSKNYRNIEMAPGFNFCSEQ